MGWTRSFYNFGNVIIVLWTLPKGGTESLMKDSVKMNTLKTNNSISIRWLSKKYLNQFHISFIALKIKSIAKLSTKFNDWNKKLSSFSEIFCKIMTHVTLMVVIYFVCLLNINQKKYTRFLQKFNNLCELHGKSIFVWEHMLR